MSREANIARSREFFREASRKRFNVVERGRKNEKRALRLMQELVNERMLKRVQKGTLKQDKAGIDFWIYPISRTEGFRVPIQVKSSVQDAKSFSSKRENPQEIAVVVVHDQLADKDVKESILRNMAIWISNNVPKAGMAEVVNAPV